MIIKVKNYIFYGTGEEIKEEYLGDVYINISDIVYCVEYLKKGFYRIFMKSIKRDFIVDEEDFNKILELLKE